MKYKIKTFLKKYSIRRIVGVIGIFITTAFITIAVNFFIKDNFFISENATIVTMTLLPIQIIVLFGLIINHIIDYSTLKKKQRKR